MDATIKKQLGESAADVFSTMYFMPVQIRETVPKEDQWQQDGGFIRTDISFSGPQNAALRFFFPRSIALAIAEGFLGVDPEDVAEKQLLDTMQEAANMVVGSFLGKVDPHGACTLGIPAAHAAPDFTPAEIAEDPDLIVLESENGCIWVTYKA